MKDYYLQDYPNRTLCEVLTEMRECRKCYNFTNFDKLIKEATVLSVRMLNGLLQGHHGKKTKK